MFQLDIFKQKGNQGLFEKEKPEIIFRVAF